MSDRPWRNTRDYERLRQAAQSSISCVSRSVLVRQPTAEDTIAVLRLTEPSGTRLGGDHDLVLLARLWISARSRVASIRSPSPSVTGYSLSMGSERTGRILVYHTGIQTASYPHLHVELRNDAIDLSNAHLPTGYVTLAAVIRMLITEFGVQPLRSDWDAVLTDADDVLMTACSTSV